MFGLLRKAYRDLRQRRLRTLLTILGIAVGVAGIVAIVSTSSNVARAQRELFVDTSQADIVYWLWDAPPSLAALLKADPRIAEAELRLSYVTRWRPASASGSGSVWRDIEIVGINDFAQVRVNRFDLLAGHYPRVGEILLDVSAARLAHVAPSGQILFHDKERRERPLRVSGLSRSPNYLSSSVTNLAVGYVPASFLRQAVGLPGNNQLLIRLRDPVDAQAVARRIDRLLRRQRIQAGAPQFRHPENLPGRRELDALLVIMALFSVLGLILSAFLVANTLSATVGEQIGEIAVLKTLGATQAHIVALYLLESLAYGLLGTALGLSLGALAGWRLLVWIGSLGNASVSFRLAPLGVLGGVIVGLGVSALGGLWPALQGARVSIKEALESYGIESDYRQSALDRLLQRLLAGSARSALPLGLAAMALRNLSRRKARTALTLLVVALATAAFLGALATRESVNNAIEEIYAIYRADAWVWFGERLDVQTEELLTTVEGVRVAEAWSVADGVVQLARARLWGMPPDTVLYRARLAQGRWFRADEPDAVVLSGELAFAQGITLNDEVVIQAQGRLRRFRVVGIAIDNTIFLGSTLSGKAFLPRETLSRMLGSEKRAGFFALGLDSREPGPADEILARLEARFARFHPTGQPVYAEIEAAQEASRLLTLGLAVMVLLVALVGSLGILNTLTLNVLERRREIAVLRVLGATNAAVIMGFLFEGLALGALGWGLGLIAGYPLGRLFVSRLGAVLFQLDFSLAPAIVAASLVFTLGLSALSSLSPALAAAQMRPDVALRYE
ncbi:MAG: ABC transporter permease [Chloroflexi bacterium]|nr:ABC transporter permease [Chloroflexota bacterium]